MYKLFTEKNELVKESKNLSELKDYARERILEADYYIKSDGLKVWDTLENDNINIFLA